MWNHKQWTPGNIITIWLLINILVLTLNDAGFFFVITVIHKQISLLTDKKMAPLRVKTRIFMSTQIVIVSPLFVIWRPPTLHCHQKVFCSCCHFKRIHSIYFGLPILRNHILLVCWYFRNNYLSENPGHDLKKLMFELVVQCQ